MLDIAVRGGDVVDGTGRPRRRADVGVRDGRIVAVGRVDEPARAEIDASGKAVTPGFVDVHTHIDAQAFWDPGLTPSPLHGVTTVFAGNCGFTIAPLSGDPVDTDYLLRMLARVEGMPVESLQTGVPWSWHSTAEYFDALEGNLGINAGFMVGHSTIRRVVAGKAATDGPVEPEQLDAMKRLLHEGLEAGAMGLSSSWARTHNDADGRMVPSRYAPAEELVELCRVVADHEGTSLEFIPCNSSVPFEPWVVELISAMSASARRPLNYNALFVRAGNVEFCRAKLAASDQARAKGARIVGLTVPMNVPTRLTFRSGFVFDAIPGWEPIMLAPYEERLEGFRDPAVRARLAELALAPHAMQGVTEWDRLVIFDTLSPDNEQFRGKRVGDIAAAEGRSAWEVLCDIVVADDLNTSFGLPLAADTDDDWKARLEIWRDPRAVIGASDAGAHLDLLASFNYTTAVLGRAVRQRQVLPLEEAVQLLTDRPARLYGLRDRGRVAEGWHADLVVLDEPRMGPGEVDLRFDLPGGAGRLYAEATGVDHVLCNGVEIVRQGQLTGARPGRVIRSGRDTDTPSID
jgi:N-acyl-D-aspartate/D-glutamate deacylase